MVRRAAEKKRPSTALTISQVRRELRRQANPAKRAILRRFFKTGPGEYGEGDEFLGLTVPIVRDIVRRCRPVPPRSVLPLLRSPLHEERLAALMILVQQFAKADAITQASIHGLYLSNTKWINNWDLVDLSAPQVVGGYLVDRDRSELDRLAGSRDVWERRIAVIATFEFIRRGQFGDTLRSARKLIADPHDLIHKAVGWMLREVGKRDQAVLEAFLRRHCHRMPRTMLRYAIERFSPAKRRLYMRRPPASG
jgi:3-methyladenine DNA glycosylase AlkD